MKSPEKLANEHWEWIAGLAAVYGMHEDMETREYLYKTAFIHGYKHACADTRIDNEAITLPVSEKEE